MSEAGGDMRTCHLYQNAWCIASHPDFEADFLRLAGAQADTVHPGPCLYHTFVTRVT